MYQSSFEYSPNRPHVRGKVLFAVLFILLSATFSVSEESSSEIQRPMCPVTPDEPIDREVYADHGDQRVYFCCQRCRRTFLNNPEQYLDRFASDAGGTDVGHVHDESSNLHIDEERHGSQVSTELGASHVNDESHNKHDHAKDHGTQNAPPKLMQFVGKFHPMAVHFPIALTLAALLAEVLALATKGQLFTAAARYSIGVAAAMAVPTAALGWAAGSSANYPEALLNILWLHRWIGTAAAAFIVLAAILSEASHKWPKWSRLRHAYQFALILACLAIGPVGHLGATLVYGQDYFSW